MNKDLSDSINLTKNNQIASFFKKLGPNE